MPTISTRRRFLAHSGLALGSVGLAASAAPLSGLAAATVPDFISGRVLAVSREDYIVDGVRVVASANAEHYANAATGAPPLIAPGSFLAAAGHLHDGTFAAETLWTDPILVIAEVKAMSPEYLAVIDDTLPAGAHITAATGISPAPGLPVKADAQLPGGGTAAILGTWMANLREISAALVYAL